MTQSEVYGNAVGKLKHLSGSQNSIETLSLWFLHYRDSADECSQAWLACLRKAVPGKRLPFFYLANHILQLAKQKGPAYLEHLAKAMTQAVTEIHRTATAKELEGIGRIVAILSERAVLDKGQLKSLRDMLDVPATHASTSRVPARKAATTAPNHAAVQTQPVSAAVQVLSDLSDPLSGALAAKVKEVNEKRMIELEDIFKVTNKEEGKAVQADILARMSTLAKYQGRLSGHLADRQQYVRALNGALRLLQRNVKHAQAFIKNLEGKKEELKGNVSLLRLKRESQADAIPLTSTATTQAAPPTAPPSSLSALAVAQPTLAQAPTPHSQPHVAATTPAQQQQQQQQQQSQSTRKPRTSRFSQDQRPVQVQARAPAPRPAPVQSHYQPQQSYAEGRPGFDGRMGQAGSYRHDHHRNDAPYDQGRGRRSSRDGYTPAHGTHGTQEASHQNYPPQQHYHPQQPSHLHYVPGGVDPYSPRPHERNLPQQYFSDNGHRGRGRGRGRGMGRGRGRGHSRGRHHYQ